jgi:DNA-binding transcriptional MerR regulator
MIRIGDFARLARISVRALRHYEVKGLLKPAHVDAHSRYRYYDLQQLAVVERLLLLKDIGLPLSAIRALLDASAQEFRTALVRHHALLQRQLLEQQALLARVSALEGWLESENGGEERGGAGIVVRTKSYPALRALSLRATVAPDANAIADMFERTERRARRSRTDQAPMLLMHSAPRLAPRLDIEVCVPVSRSCRLNDVREIESEPLAASVTYRGPYAQPTDLYRRMRTWLSRQQMTLAPRPIREIYHRFGADQIGYRLPAHRVAASAQSYVTELAIPLVHESP